MWFEEFYWKNYYRQKLRNLDDQSNYFIDMSRRCVNNALEFGFASPFGYLFVDGT
jgi:hypothetical protein